MLAEMGGYSQNTVNKYAKQNSKASKVATGHKAFLEEMFHPL